VILLTGFGPFGDVVDNPSARLVRAVHGLVGGGHRLQALVLPVQWGEATRRTVRAARELGPALVLGFGVATRRAVVEVEALGRPARSGLDVLGRPPPVPDDDGDDGDDRPATVDVDRLVTALGAGRSDDAGAYLCNAWLHEVTAALSCPTGFVHVPPDGLAPGRLIAALDAYCG
jgi:pyroglutamyl-peptidase